MDSSGQTTCRETVKSIKSCPRVEPVVDLPQPRLEDVRVDLRRREIGVAEHQLDGAQVGASLERMGRKRVPQHVRTERARQMRAASMLLQDLPEADAAERAAARVDEQARRAARLEELAAGARLVFADPARRLLPDRDE